MSKTVGAWIKKEDEATYHLEEDYLRGIEESWYSLGGSTENELRPHVPAKE